MINLGPKAFAVLSYLITHPGRLVTKKELLQAVWPDVCVTDSVLKVRVGEVRKALGDPVQDPRIIETLHRRGYRFIAKVVPELNSADGAIDPALLLERSGALIGREQVLAQLHKHLRCTLRGDRQLVFVTGEAGIGKTAVVDEFLAQVNAQSEVLMLTGQCVEHYGTGEAYLPMLEALSRLGRQVGAERLAEMLKQYAPTWLAQLPWLVADSERAPLQHEILGTTGARMLREMGELCGALTRETPVVLALEDLHWSDYATLDLISMLAQQRERARLLVLGTYRPVELVLREHPLKVVKQELELHRQCTEISLEFLNTAEVAEFLHLRFPDNTFPPRFAPVINRRTDGNALFLLNVIDYLLGEGVLAKHGGHWRLTVALEEIQKALPESLQLMIEKQIDRLDVEQQQVLVSASIAGAKFTAAAVAAGLGLDMKDVEACCADLAQIQQFLRPLGTTELPDGTQTARYAFVHTLYQDVLRRRLPASHRARLHLAIGLRKETAFAGRAHEIAAELALHFEQGRDLRRAVDYLRQAASNARYRHANRAALRYLERALHVLESLASEETILLRLQLLQERGFVYQAMADMAAAAEVFTELLTCARELHLVDWEITALLQLATVTSWLDRERCLAVVAEVLQLCDNMENSDLETYARGWCAYWNLLWREWREQDAEACAAAVTAARLDGRREQLSSLLGRYSYFQSMQADYRAAAATAAKGMRVALVTGEGSDYLLSLFFRGWALLHSGEWDTLYTMLRGDALHMAQKNQHHLWILLFQLQLAWLAEESFSFETARDLSARALEEARQRDLPYGRLLGTIRLGSAQLGLGQLQQAFGCFRGSADWLAQDRVLMDWILKMPLHYGLSRYWLARGDYPRAQQEARKVCRLAAQPGERTYLALGYLALAEIAVAQQDQHQAHRELKRALIVLDGVNAPLAEWRVCASARELAVRQGDHEKAEQYRIRSATILRSLAASLKHAPDLCRSLVAAAPVRTILGRVPQREEGVSA